MTEDRPSNASSKAPSAPPAKGASKPQQDAKTTTANGKNATTDESSTPPGIPVWGMLLMAVVSMILGLLTPPLLVKKTTSTSKSGVGVTVPQGVILDDSNDVLTKRSLLHDDEDDEHAASSTVFSCTEDFLKDFWHDDPVQGFHIVCLDRKKTSLVQATFYKNGMASAVSHATLESAPTRDAVAWQEFRGMLEKLLNLPVPQETYNFQPWAAFSPVGQRIVDAGLDEEEGETRFMDALSHYGVFLIYEGGQFLWPGVRIGFERHVDLYSVMPIGSPEMKEKNRTVTLQTLSLVPLVVSVQGFLSDEECTYIETKAQPSMRYSDVVLMDKDVGRPASDFRTSQSTFLSSKRDTILQDIDQRTASLTRIPRLHQEHVQVLRYGHLEKYDHHTDYFDPKLYSNDETTLKLIGHGRKNRLATVFWYLSDVAEGGETAFPSFNGQPVRSMQDCSSGLLVKPERGKVIIFYSLHMDGTMDEHSLHGACPVKDGVKWAANKWVWNEEMPYYSAS